MDFDFPMDIQMPEWDVILSASQKNDVSPFSASLQQKTLHSTFRFSFRSHETMPSFLPQADEVVRLLTEEGIPPSHSNVVGQTAVRMLK